MADDSVADLPQIINTLACNHAEMKLHIEEAKVLIDIALGYDLFQCPHRSASDVAAEHNSEPSTEASWSMHEEDVAEKCTKATLHSYLCIISRHIDALALQYETQDDYLISAYGPNLR